MRLDYEDRFVPSAEIEGRVVWDALEAHAGLGDIVVVQFGRNRGVRARREGRSRDVPSCYKTSCDFVPNCMDLISAEMVEVAVIRQLAIHRAQHMPEASSV